MVIAGRTGLNGAVGTVSHAISIGAANAVQIGSSVAEIAMRTGSNGAVTAARIGLNGAATVSGPLANGRLPATAGLTVAAIGVQNVAQSVGPNAATIGAGTVRKTAAIAATAIVPA